MKRLLFLIIVIRTISSWAQPGLYRHYTQPLAPSSLGWSANPQKPQPTADGGYLLTNWQLLMGFESPGGLGSGSVIKTDSSFVPQWKKAYANAIALPTGGIILIRHNTIEKVTASGVQIWMKQLTTPVMLTDAVAYGNKIRFVGVCVSYSYVPATTLVSYTGDGFTLLTDTGGNYISHKLFHSSVINSFSFLSYNYRGTADFSKIKRDAQGNFFVYSQPRTMAGIGSNMAIAKFDTSFSFLWGKTWASGANNISITDLDILPNGRIFASGVSTGNSNVYYNMRAALFKFSSQGNLVGQCFFENRLVPGALSKKTNGNYVVGIRTADSLFMLEADTSMNVVWHKYVGKGSEIGGTTIRTNNRLFTTQQYGVNMLLISHNINGNSCSSYSISYTKPTSSVSLTNFTLSNTAYTTALVNGTVNSIASQAYVDSCKCPVFIAQAQNNLCVGNVGTFSIVGTGNLSWYNTATGNSFLQSGPQYTFASATPTSITVYAQDSACALNPLRTPILITVYGVPSLSFNPANPSICIGSNVFVSVIGANSYTWSHNLSPGNIQNLNPLSSNVYTVTGSVAPGCSNTKTLALTVVPLPTVVATSSGTLCVGQTGTVSATGGTSYSWSNGQTSSTFTINPLNAGVYNYNVAGSNGVCNAYASTSITAIAVPTVVVVCNPATVCVGATATINASGATSYSWSSGGNGNSRLISPSSGTSYIVSGFNSACSASATVNVFVQAPPVVLVSGPASTQCVGSPVTLSVSGAASYTWSNGANTSSLLLNVIAGANTYSVKGSNGTCSASSQVTVTGVPVPTISAFVNPAFVCVGTTPTVSVLGAMSYSWSNGFTSPAFTINPLAPGLISLSVTGSNGPCSAATLLTLTALPLPTISLVSSSPSLCAGSAATISAAGATSYSWNTGSLGQFIIATPGISSQYVVKGISNNCSATASVFIPVQAVPVLALNSTGSIVCVGNTVTLSVSGAGSYTWSNGFNTPTISYAALLGNTQFSVTGSFGNCTSSAFTSVQGIAVPTVTVVSNPTLLCTGLSATLTAIGATSYTWGNAATTGSIVITPNAPINMSVYGATGSCANLQVFSLNVFSSPTLYISSNRPAMCAGEAATLTATGANSYIWNTGAGTGSILISPATTSTYTVQGINQYGCLSTTIYSQVVDLCTAAKGTLSARGLIRIYPNPAKGSFIIETGLQNINSVAQVKSVEGKILLTVSLTSETTLVDINQLPAGVYFVSVEGTGYFAKIIRN